MNAGRWRWIALTSLVALMVVSLLLVVASPTGSAAAAGRAASPVPPGSVLAVVKVLLLFFIFQRVRKTNVYSLQWSSMFILLLVAEGVVRAGSDPSATAGLGLVEALCALAYFVAVLAILRPIKQRARAAARDPSRDALHGTPGGAPRAGSVDASNDAPQEPRTTGRAKR